MPAIYLIRHGQASFGQENYDQLSELGEQQAAHLGSAFAKRLSSFDAIGLGTMLRHKQTAELCLSAMGQEFDQENAQSDSGWNEYDHQNILGQFNPQLATAESTDKFIRAQNNPLKAFEEAFNGAVLRWMSTADGAGYTESWSQYSSRIHEALRDVVVRNPEAKKVAVFTSGGPISLLSQAFLGVPEDQLMRLNWTLVNCGITKLLASDRKTIVSSLNEHAHFEGQTKQLITYK